VSQQGYRHLFGPVPSRRLGRSLGIDPVPHKTCSFDCVYCQLGPTTHHTAERRPYVPATQIIAELEYWLEQDGCADYLTLSGSGEPTLNCEIGDVIHWAQSHTTIPIAVLTNSSLLWDPEVRAQLATADLLLPSLDAALASSFARVNRPCTGLDLDRVLAGLKAMSDEFAGEIWLEVLLVEDINSSPEDLLALAAAVHDLRHERVQINTVVRPPAESCARPVTAGQLQEACLILGPRAEIIAPLEGLAGLVGARKGASEALLELLNRRPCDLADLAMALGIHRNEVAKYINILLRGGLIESVEVEGKTFFRARQNG